MSTLKANRIENLTTTNGGIDINNSGNVGVGASSPGANLEVRGSSSNGQIRIGGSTSGTYSQIYSDNDGVLILNADQGNNAASSYLGLNVDNSERLRIDSSGRLLIGTTSALDVGSTKTIQVVNTSTASLSLGRNDGTISAGNDIGAIRFWGNAGGSYQQCAEILAEADGTHANNDKPTRLVFSTTADSGSSPTERMRIAANGDVGIGIAPAAQKLQVHESTASTESYVHITNAVSGGTSADGMLLGMSTSAEGIVWNAENTSLLFATNNTERMRIDSSGNVGIGTTSPGNPLHIANQNPSIRLQSNSGSYQGRNTIGQYNNILYFECDNDNAVANSAMAFTVDATERMRITSGGNIGACGADGSILVGAGNTSTGFVIESAGGGTEGALFISRAATQVLYLNRNNNGSLVGFSRSGTGVGSIAVTSSSTNYNTTSDYRLKENVVDLSGAITRVKQLAPRRFNFIAEPDSTVDGFLAHEAQTVVPEAVTGTHNEVDADGNPVYQGIDQSKLVPLLTAALQEAIAKIETLETKVAALEAAE